MTPFKKQWEKPDKLKQTINSQLTFGQNTSPHGKLQIGSTQIISPISPSQIKIGDGLGTDPNGKLYNSNGVRWLTNGTMSTIQPATIVAVNSMGQMILAQAADLTKVAIGICLDAVNSNAQGPVVCAGTIGFTNWTNAFGSTTLTPETVYWLSPSSAGTGTSSPTFVSGNLIQPIGRAITNLILELALGSILEK